MLIKTKNLKRFSLIAIINLTSSSNNTLLNISTIDKKTIFIGSGGLLAVKGSRRSTSYVGQTVATIFGKKLFLMGIKYVFLKIKGFGSARYSGIKGFFLAGLKILAIQDLTPIPFNGCKAPKKRRI